tara:strand:+ start:12697 stop:14187 length:1491 start_codon:yes stop_codon:yes gene_type:complete
MAYTVNKTNSSASPNAYTVQDSVLNTQTDLSFVGKGYAGYGETIAENFLHLLENFSNSSAPSKPITGQLWYDESANKLKVYDGSFKPVSGAEYQSSEPSGQQQGDLWIDSDTQQLYFYNGSSNILVGPPASTGTLNGFVYNTIADSTDTNQNVTYWYNDGNLIAIISEDTFTPKVSISGFSTITKGITLSTAISDLKFAGTSTDSDALGGVAAANYLRSNANDTTSGTLGVVNDTGLTVGADSDIKISVDGTGGIIQNQVADTDITFKINDGGVTTTVMTIDGATSRVGIGTTSPSTKLDISGTTTSTAFAGALTGDVTGNLSSSGANTMGSLVMSGNITSQNIVPAANATYDIGSSSLGYNVVYAKATSAQYADLAEIYESDSSYEPGTVVVFGGDKEITVANTGNDTRVAGVISENPAYLMNSKANGLPVALTGKVKCKVAGFIRKGDMLATHNTLPGVAKKISEPTCGAIIGKALEDYDSTEIGSINIVVGRC